MESVAPMPGEAMSQYLARIEGRALQLPEIERQIKLLHAAADHARACQMQLDLLRRTLQQGPREGRRGPGLAPAPQLLVDTLRRLGPASVGDLVTRTGLKRNTASASLSTLLKAGTVQRKAGVYSLTDGQQSLSKEEGRQALLDLLNGAVPQTTAELCAGIPTLKRAAVIDLLSGLESEGFVLEVRQDLWRLAEC